MNNIKIRRLKDNSDEYHLLEKWYQNEEIYSHFEQRKLSFDEIKTKYYPRTLDNAKIPVYMILYEDIPVGIIQYQLISEENKKLYGISEKDSYEIDIFIGEVSLHNKGIGKSAINILCKYLFNELNANILVICPLKDNINAIKCYSKCGFKIRNNFKTEDTIGEVQEYVLMVKKGIRNEDR